MILMLATAALTLAGAPEDALERGMAAQQSGDSASAIAAYQECLEHDPGYLPCHWELGWSHWTDANWQGVVDHWHEVQALGGHPQLHRWLPTAEQHLGALQAIRQAAADAPASNRPPLPAGRTIRLRAAGDIMMGSDFPDTSTLPAEDGATLLTAVVPLLSDADFTFGNLEGPLCDGGVTSKCKPEANCYAFRTPTRYGAYLQQAGFDVMSTANNHAADFGDSCREATETTLDGLGIAHSGRPGSIATLEVDGAKIGVIAFHTSPTSNYLLDTETAVALVSAAAGAHDLVVVSFHGGAEGSGALHVPDHMEVFYGEKRGHLRAFAAAVVQAGADVVIGHGPHVPRGLQVIDGRLVAYSLGNFATYGRFSLKGFQGTSLVLEATVDHEGRLVRGAILPVKLVGEGIPVPDDEGTAIDLLRSLSEEDFGQQAPRIAQDGTFAPR